MSGAPVSLDDQIKAIEWSRSLLHPGSERARILAAAADTLRELRISRVPWSLAPHPKSALDNHLEAARVDDTRVSQAFERARMPV